MSFLEVNSSILEKEITEKQKMSSHDIREYPIGVIVDKFLKGIKNDESELFIPDYQREFRWSKKQQREFIESILLNLPIPYLFVADNGEGRLEIVDGSQRVRTLVEFVTNKLSLDSLKYIPSANGLFFEDFPKVRQLRFLRKTLRMIELTEEVDEDARRELFARLNSGGSQLVEMEIRRGRSDGEFLKFIRRLSKDKLFHTVCPLSIKKQKKSEYDELVLRYFAYSENYLGFKHSVDAFLNDYIKSKENGFNEEEMEYKFQNMLEFVNKYFDNGFRKTSTAQTVPRLRFEVIATGVTLALNINPQLIPRNVDQWLESQEFIKHTRSDASNSRPKVKSRIEFVRDKLLGGYPYDK
ncbi:MULTISPECIES: DUF262 domain-containing protein [Pasteurellaceae]|uniref:DUF262 domain-containing protein n=3 Tax=Pasteurellaceae TaxID=712 RepID=A0AAW8CH30_9PAST|nr:DUF262 domain-containing protein [Pasteurella atlantica]MBR0574185.1 DUF262 domain-containing protein [Pasteurella atlantica]MDP8039294.1 DUF262 domain-containing protein [Pasteurella atlantica]MDP8041386.1 DUF262 domain-containing protein [Pasteurella atlantica]MDP8043522.1 DUF262 domain-containing protein [Pasteurella atlantica]MDP8045560.1 DUF262 domain-containing protein [Pasteurella atlantica]